MITRFVTRSMTSRSIFILSIQRLESLNQPRPQQCYLTLSIVLSYDIIILKQLKRVLKEIELSEVRRQYFCDDK